MRCSTWLQATFKITDKVPLTLKIGVGRLWRQLAVVDEWENDRAKGLTEGLVHLLTAESFTHQHTQTRVSLCVCTHGVMRLLILYTTGVKFLKVFLRVIKTRKKYEGKLTK